MFKGRLLLVNLPVSWPKTPPIGLGYLQAFLSHSGINTEILDLNNTFYNLADDNLKRQWLVSCNVFLEKNILNILREKYLEEYHLALERMSGYGAVGFSCFKSNFSATLEVARLLKKGRKDIKIILGGPEIARQFFKKKGRLDSAIAEGVDFFVAGEGEKALRDYLKAEKSTKNIAAFEQLEDLGELPFPTYSGLDLSSYPGKYSIPLQFSRGCVRKCSFCSERLLYKDFRLRGTDSVIDEIRYHKAEHNTRYFVFFDSLINGDLAALEELCDKITANFGTLPWEAQIAIRSDMPERIFEKMKRSGCYHLFVGLESGSDRVLERMQKGFNTWEAHGFFRKLHNSGLSFGVSIILGYPGETEADFRESLDFLIRNKDTITKIEQVNPFTYYDGTTAGRESDYKVNKKSLEGMEIFVREIKRHNFKYTRAFLGNLMEKDARA